nr:RHOMBOID-like protein 12, mitochondrial isoform X2 [Solanum lycopersicum]
MQRLLSLKLLPQIHRNLSNGATNLSKANHCFSAPYTTSSHSWRLQNVKFSHGVFSNPLFSKQLLANTHFRGDPSKVLAYRTVGLGRTQLGRRNFHSNSLVGSIRRSWRSSYGRFSTDGVVLCLIFTNVAVFLLWRVADSRFMMRNFMIGRYFGPEFLLKLYLSGAVAGSVFYLLYHAFIVPSLQTQRGQLLSMHPSQTLGLGASGAVNAVMLLDIFLFPTKIVYFNLVIPVPAILLGIFMVGKDVLRIYEGDTLVSGSAHLGGAAMAAITWARVRRGRF